MRPTSAVWTPAVRVLALALACWLGPIPVARSEDSGLLRTETPPYFNADMTLAFDSTGVPGVSVSISLPFRELQWVRVEGGFAAAVEFTVSLEQRGESRIFGGSWERRPAVPNFESTRSPRAALIEHSSFRVPAGSYDVRVTVKDRRGEQSSLARGRLDVPDLNKIPVGFAALEVGTADSLGEFTPNLTRRFGLEVRALAARVTLFDRRSGSWPRNYPFHYRLLDDRGEELLRGTSDLSLSRSGEPVLIRPTNRDLFIGAYTIEVELVDGKSRWKIAREFEVEESGPPQGREFERMLEPLAYVADAREIDVLRALPLEEQTRGWEEFWKRRDPTPETVRNEAMIEFLRRVSYADRHFQGFGPGWRSDMGRIYIKNGAPEQTETRSASAETAQLEIWYYSQPYRRYVFADREGFGRFVLVSPVGE